MKILATLVIMSTLFSISAFADKRCFEYSKDLTERFPYRMCIENLETTLGRGGDEVEIIIDQPGGRFVSVNETILSATRVNKNQYEVKSLGTIHFEGARASENSQEEGTVEIFGNTYQYRSIENPDLSK